MKTVAEHREFAAMCRALARLTDGRDKTAVELMRRLGRKLPTSARRVCQRALTSRPPRRGPETLMSRNRPRSQRDHSATAAKMCHLTQATRERTKPSAVWPYKSPDSRAATSKVKAKTMSTRSYFLHQAQVCGSLARGTDDPKLKQRYEDLAVEFLQRGSRESDAEIDFLPSTGAKPKPDSGDASAHG